MNGFRENYIIQLKRCCYLNMHSLFTTLKISDSTAFSKISFFSENYLIIGLIQGRPQDLGGGGGQEIFFSDWGICMSQSDMLRMASPCALLGGFGGMLPREKIFKTVQFGAF